MSNNSSSSSSSSGIGCGGLLAVLLTVLFVGLKLTGHITWSWIWVISPLLIYIGIGIVFLLIVLGIIILAALGVGFAEGLKKKKARKRREALLEEQRFATARPLGDFNSVGEKVKERKPHSWML